MLVYGDQERRADPRHLISSINRRINAVAGQPPGLQRHAALVASLIETGQLLQGLLDDSFARTGRDACQPDFENVDTALHMLATAVRRSWDSGFADLSDLPNLAAGQSLPAEVRLKLPEGFAFYAVYPEAYAEAARRLVLTAPPKVIGLRSIGTTLGAVVAAALEADSAVSLRPVGDPFDRKVTVEPSLERRLLDGERHYIIVDEGPGQSGSSFASVRRWLRDKGVSDDRIALLPSHDGEPGSEARAELRDWWRSAQREVADLGNRLPELVGQWVEPIIGPLDEPVREISSGGWRSLHYAVQEKWPAVVPVWESRKFLCRSGGEAFLAKFAGVGPVGEEKLAIARSLYLDGLSPEPIGIVHGFLIERWVADAGPVGDEKPVAEIARYIATRARSLPRAGEDGTGIAELIQMARRNISLEFGDDAAKVMNLWETQAAALESAVVRIATDNRMQPHEWLRTAKGKLLKTDALDHHQAHDLVGCQDVGWDIAGAAIEWNLDEDGEARLVEIVEAEAKHRTDPQLLDFYEVAYLAFRLGQMRLGETMTGDAEERARIRASGNAYAGRLQLLLHERTAATPRESLVD